MSDNLVQLTDADFEENIVNSDKLAVVDFWAEWCAPCKMLTPMLEELADEYKGKVKMGEMNVDHNNQTATRYAIRSLPTVLFFKGGNIIKQIVGVRPKVELKAVIENNL